MPYEQVKDLPESVRRNLPARAREIYLAAFNNAWEDYADPGDRRNQEDLREETSHKVAWAAVKQSYERNGEGWVRKPT
jgi:cation transport regulator